MPICIRTFSLSIKILCVGDGMDIVVITRVFLILTTLLRWWCIFIFAQSLHFIVAELTLGLWIIYVKAFYLQFLIEHFKLFTPHCSSGEHSSPGDISWFHIVSSTMMTWGWRAKMLSGNYNFRIILSRLRAL